MNSVYIIMPDRGCEGLAEPIAVFDNYEESVRVLNLLRESNGIYKLFKLPMWQDSGYGSKVVEVQGFTTS